MSFLKQYKVSFRTKDGYPTSIIVGAMDASWAIDIVRGMADFDSLIGYPEEIIMT